MTKIRLDLSSLLLILAITGQANAQIHRKKPDGAVINSFSITGKTAQVYTTAKGTDARLTKTQLLTFKDKIQPVETDICVFIDPSHTFQTILGIGGALTDASAETFYKLPIDKQKEFMTSLYDTQNGIGYSLARTNIQSCDFSSDSYSYVTNNDKELKTFSVAHDLKYRVPFIKQAIAAAGGKLTMFVSPWSPPAWMKSNNDVLHGGKLLPAYDQSWANFYVKFINTYEKLGIPIWGLTVQNEPMAIQNWESCQFSATDERDFVKNYLGPTLYKHGLNDKKLIVWDHNRDLIYQRASTIFDDKDASKYIWGIGYHWYETWTGSAMQFDNVKAVHETFPTKNLLFTEGCIEKFDYSRLNDWALGERYGRSMIHDLNNGTVGWTDWNVLLDETGGPNHAGNFCFSPVIADLRSGQLTYTNSYYYIGHFSKFVRPGDKRIASSSNRDKLLATAFINSQGKITIVVMNGSDDELTYNLCLQGKAAESKAMPHSINTIIIQ